MTPPKLLTLDCVEVGQAGVIESISGEDSLATRIMEMGVTPGATFTMIGTAPLGDPIEIEIRDYRLSLRKSEARRVGVHLDDNGC
jgi:ferrous iron transport protein A